MGNNIPEIPDVSKKYQQTQVKISKNIIKFNKKNILEWTLEFMKKYISKLLEIFVEKSLINYKLSSIWSNFWSCFCKSVEMIDPEKNSWKVFMPGYFFKICCANIKWNIFKKFSLGSWENIWTKYGRNLFLIW